MGRIIINNRSDHSDCEVTIIIANIIGKGRISNEGKQYCYLTSYGDYNDKIDIFTDLRKGCDSFTVYNSPNKSR